MSNLNTATLNNNESEKAVIGTLLVDRSACNRIPRVIKSEDFFNTDNRQVYRAICSILAAQNEVSILSVSNELARSPETKHYNVEYLEPYLDYSVSAEDALTFATQLSEIAGTRTLAQWNNTFVAAMESGTRLVDLTSEMMKVGRDLSMKGAVASFATGEALREEFKLYLSRERSASSLLGLEEFDKHVYDFQPTEVVVVAARPGIGKAIPNDEYVLTPQGWRMHGYLRPGDKVIGSNGKPTTVVSVYPQKGGCKTYRLKLKDGGSVRCSADHLWMVRKSTETRLESFDANGKAFTTTTEDLKNLISDADYYIPTLTEPFEHVYNSKHTYIDGFRVGVDYLSQESVSYGPVGYILHEGVEFRRGYLAAVLSVHSRPGKYLRKREVKTCGSLVLEVQDEDTAHAFCELVFSLAGHATIHTEAPYSRIDNVAPYYVEVQYLKDGDEYNTFNYLPVTVDFSDFNATEGRLIESIEFLEDNVPSKCIKVMAEDSLYVVKDYIITHNTTFATQSAAHQVLDLNKKIGFISMEMSKPKILIRMLAARLGHNNRDIDEMTFDDFKEVTDAESVLFALTEGCVIEDTGPFTTDSVISKLYAMFYEFGAKTFYIDYLGLINSDNEKSGNRQEHISAASRRIKEFAMTTKSEIVLMSQLNRAVEGRASNRPILPDLRESGAVEQDASLIIFLYANSAAIGATSGADEVSAADIEAYIANNTEVPLILEVAKQRNGPKFPVEVIAQQPYSRFITKGSNKPRFQKKTVMDDDDDNAVF